MLATIKGIRCFNTAPRLRAPSYDGRGTSVSFSVSRARFLRFGMTTEIDSHHHLTRAYMLGGPEAFQDEDPALIEHLRRAGIL